MAPKYDSKSKKTLLRRKKSQTPPSSSSSESDTETIYSTVDESESENENTMENVSTSSSSYVSPRRKDRKKSSTVITSGEDEESQDDSDFVEGEEDALSEGEIRRQIAKMFPSKYMSDKLKKNIMKKHESSEDSECESDDSHSRHRCRHKKSHKKSSSHKKDKKKDKLKRSKKDKEKERRKKRDTSSSSDEDDESDFYEEESYSEDDFDSEDIDRMIEDSEENQKLNIFLTIGGGGPDDNEDEYNEENESDENDDDCGSDVEKTFMKENYQEVIMPEETKDSTDSSDAKPKKKSKKENAREKSKSKTKDAEQQNEPTDIEKEYLELLDLKKHLTDKLHKNPKSKILRNAIKECNLSIRKLIKNARTQNTKMYYEMTRTEKKRTNEIDYFKKKLSNKEQLKIMRDLKEINEHLNIEKPYRLSLLQSKIPAKFKAVAMHKLNMLRNMEPGDPEYHKVKNWVDTFMKIPFGTYKNLSININDGIDVCSEFLEKSKKTLDECVFGLDDAKLQIMQMLGQWISNPAALGTAIAIKGAMGTGKTTLVKEGISKILGREFAFIALGGASDSSFLEGHSYTYEGSTWGKIVQILIDSKCMNPVIYFDELDKISDTPKGQEIVGILTHLTDTSQNSQFHDKYFSEIDFDLSKCLFIFSYNDENLVNPILRDRMYRIQTKGYDSKEKTVITKNYLLPKIRDQVKFNAEDIIIPDDTIQYIVSSNKFTKGEEGVRNLKRCLEIIYTKLNLFRLMKTNNPMLKQQMQMEVEFPFTVLRKHVDILIKGEDYQNQSFLSLYV